MSRFFVRAPRGEVRSVVANERGYGSTEVRESAPHTATQIGVFGRVIDATPEGDFEVSEDEHRDLITNYGFEHSRVIEDKAPAAPKKAVKADA